MKALDKDGNKIFTLEDKLALMHKVDSDVLSRIATAMVQAINPQEVKKLKSEPELKNCFILADRLKITLREVLQIEELEYNHWLGYLLLEQEQHEQAMKNKAQIMAQI